MNKRFLSAILFGALMVTSTGTFVSCKDYDDDISELWDAVNGQKTDLTAKVTAVESSISSLQSAQTALEGKITEAKDAGEKAALEAQKAAIAAAAEELAGVKAELEATIAKLQNATEAEVAAVKEDVTKIEASIAEVDGKVIALQAFQATTEKTLEALAQADVTLGGTISGLDAQVKANAIAIGKNATAINAQIEALNNYIESNDEAVSANTTAIGGILDTLDGYKTLLESLNAFDVEATQNAINGLTEKYDKVSADISTIKNSLEVLSAAVYQGVTHVSLITNLAPTSEEDFNWGLELLSAEAVRTWTFGEGLTGAIEFDKGKRSTFTDSFIIRVSPTDAVVTGENIKLINSQGADLEGLVTVADVKPYTGLLTRGISNTGLWEVFVEMDENYDADKFVEATAVPKKDNEDNAKKILYAVSLNTTLDKANAVYSREVVSEYGITFSNDAQEPVTELKFTVDDKDVDEIHNRAKKSEETQTKTPTEYVWLNSAEDISEPIFDDKNEKCNTEEGDNRQIKDILPIVLKKAFTVQLDETIMKAASAFYIVLDKKRAVSSDDSEIEAWNAAEPSILGINKVYNVSETKGKAEITIDNNVKDVYGFRVYAVNHDGSLIDPDGKAFYVVAGDAAEELSAYSVQKTWTANGKAEISKAPVAEGVFGDWLKEVKTVDVIKVDTVAYGSSNEKSAFTVKYSTKKDGEAKEFAEGTKAADVKFITVETNTKAPDYWYDDGKTYSSTLAFKNSRGQVLKTLTVNFKKVLPTFPATFQAKVNQLAADGTLNAFMIPATPVNGVINGTKNLVDSFNGLKLEDDSYDKNFIFTFADAAKNAEDEVEALKVTYNAVNNYQFTVANGFIDNETSHVVTVSYNFGEISSVAYGAKDGNNYIVKGGEFKNIIFSCLAKINEYAWVKAPELTYEDSDGTRTAFSNIKSTNERDGKYSTTLDKLLTEAKDYMIQDLKNAEYELWSQVAKGGAIKEGSKNEYFIPTYAAKVDEVKDSNGKVTTPAKPEGILFSKGSSKQNPEETVYSTLIIKAKDYFGHDVVIKIADLEVKKR